MPSDARSIGADFSNSNRPAAVRLTCRVVRSDDGSESDTNKRKHLIMATPSLRLPENVSGAFYVTSERIDCDLCREEAPDICRRTEEIGHGVVFHQSETTEEIARAVAGKEGCPVEAIGRD